GYKEFDIESTDSAERTDSKKLDINCINGPRVATTTGVSTFVGLTTAAGSILAESAAQAV
ncbi:7640_t:CDS:1, partial [Racocetra fulgida]